MIPYRVIIKRANTSVTDFFHLLVTFRHACLQNDSLMRGSTAAALLPQLQAHMAQVLLLI